MTTKDVTRCEHCKAPILPSQMKADFVHCVFCGWEDYEPPADGLEVPMTVTCPGAGRSMLPVDTGGRSNSGRCAACLQPFTPNRRGLAPVHHVESNEFCEGSGTEVVRVEWKTRERHNGEGRHEIRKGCRGCGLIAEGKIQRVMRSHRIAESPKVATQLNNART